MRVRLPYFITLVEIGRFPAGIPDRIVRQKRLISNRKGADGDGSAFEDQPQSVADSSPLGATEIPDDSNVSPPSVSVVLPPENDIPRWEDCSKCYKCADGHQGNSPEIKYVQHEFSEVPLRRLLQRSTPDVPFRRGSRAAAMSKLRPKELSNFRMAPVPPDNSLPECAVCSGCSTQLIPMVKTKTFANVNYTMEVGASPANVYRAYSSLKHGALGVVKLWCLPKKNSKGEYMKFQGCSSPKEKIYSTMLRKVAGMQKVCSMCGLERLNAQAWAEHVRSVQPHTGIKVDAHGLFMEKVDGISLATLMSGKPMTTPATRLKMLNMISSEAVVEAAITDLLLSQCDRHPQNVFLNPEGVMRFIDNDQGLADAWRPCQVDSIFLPTTEKFEIARAGWRHIGSKGKEPMAKHPNPLRILDYRCHVTGGAIGKDYPPNLKLRHVAQTCLQKLASVDERTLELGLNLPEKRHAGILRERAQAMLKDGFEKALADASSRQTPTFPVADPCCNITLVKNAFHCSSTATREGAVDAARFTNATVSAEGTELLASLDLYRSGASGYKPAPDRAARRAEAATVADALRPPVQLYRRRGAGRSTAVLRPVHRQNRGFRTAEVKSEEV
ncbi:hypothetical protein CYMTET_35274 [Cymbomonas tetramitiformis]|uniref:PI3K/PI4K catalytic domain-containing protein n=1 Tax=Cymbomonas tetramitiformis TaxID=36881 RepID=A0AAE0F9M0_9CHLO|nr:hypothetical protein CYMTET_35274 [Cymbomonas tetramitiformis]